MLGKNSYAIVIMEDERGGYIAVCPSFEGCIGRGNTREEALDVAAFELDRIVDQCEVQGVELPSPRPAAEPEHSLEDLAGRASRMQEKLNEAECKLRVSCLATRDKFRRLREHCAVLPSEQRAG